MGPDVFAVLVAVAPERMLVAWAIKVERSVVVGVAALLFAGGVSAVASITPGAAWAAGGCWRFEASTVAWMIMAERSDPAATGVALTLAGTGVAGAESAGVAVEVSAVGPEEVLSDFCFGDEVEGFALGCCVGVGWDEGVCC